MDDMRRLGDWFPGLSIEGRDAICPEHGAFMSRNVFGRIWSKCPECNRLDAERKAAEKKASEDAERQRRIEQSLDRAGIPARFRGRSFDNFAVSLTGQEMALAAAMDYAANFAERSDDGATLVFSGKPGTGKSHLAIAICQHVMQAGYTAMYLNALDAIRAIRATWSRSSERTETEVMNSFARVGLLALDEVGMQYGTDGEQVILFDIINRRYQDQMPTILLTNQGRDGFKKYLGDRAFDRLREGGKWVAFDWESQRGKGV